MTEDEMFEVALTRPRNYFQLSDEAQWQIDKELGILDWKGDKLTPEQLQRLNERFL